jgi:hypothetical protein
VALTGGLQDLAGEPVADLGGKILGIGEARAPGHAVGAIGVMQHFLAAARSAGPKAFSNSDASLRAIRLLLEGVATNKFPDFRRTF